MSGYGPAYDAGYRAGYAGERTLDQALPATLGTDERSQFWRGYHAGVTVAYEDRMLRLRADREGVAVSESERDAGVLHMLEPDFDGQGKSYREESDESMRAMAFVLVAVALAALGFIGLVAWLALR